MSKHFSPNPRRTTLAIVIAVTAFALLASGAVAIGDGNGPTSQPPLPAPPKSANAADATTPAAAESPISRPSNLEEAVATGKLDRKVLKPLRDKGTVDVIVSFKSQEVLQQAKAGAPTGAGHDKAIIEQSELGFAKEKDRALEPLGGGAQVLHDYDVLPASFVRIHSAKALLELAQSGDVLTVGANESGTTTLAQSLPLIRQPTAAAAGYRGDGTYVAVLDTGVDYTRAAFGSCTGPSTPATCKVSSSWDAAPNDNSRDDDGHGTNVAGIVAGVAPGAKIMAVDVFARDAAGRNHYSDTALLNGITWVINQKKAGVAVKAMNMSLDVPDSHYTSTCNSSFTTVFNAARQADILPVVSAGNFANKGTGYTDGIASPACTAGALSVGAVYDANVGSVTQSSGCSDTTTAADKIGCFSQGGPNLTMLAPGAMITAAGITGIGTSQAAPHVAGAAAVLAAASPSAHVDQIQSALASSGPTITDSRSGTTRTFHRLDVASALASLVGDRVAPKVTTPTQAIASLSSAKISWTGSDDLSGVSEYHLWKWTQDATSSGWSEVPLPSPTATSVTVPVQQGKRYAFTVGAYDKARNWSGFSANSPLFSPKVYEDTSSTIDFVGDWIPDFYSSYSGGSATYTYAFGDAAMLSFSGLDVAWIGSLDVDGGTADVDVDGSYRRTVSQQSTATSFKRLLYQRIWSSAGSHTIELDANGDGFTDVDAFVVYQ
jgi:subtilisin family serine protease